MVTALAAPRGGSGGSAAGTAVVCVRAGAAVGSGPDACWAELFSAEEARAVADWLRAGGAASVAIAARRRRDFGAGARPWGARAPGECRAMRWERVPGVADPVLVCEIG